MTLLPRRAFTIETTLAPNEGDQRLRRAVEERKWPHPSGHGAFQGGVLFASSIALRPLFQRRTFDPGGFIPLGMLVFGVLLVLGGFIPEARKALRELAKIVDASHADFTRGSP